MLKQRVITALIMASVFLAAIAYLPLPGLAVLFGIIIAMGAWEWSNLAGWQKPIVRATYVLTVVAALIVIYRYCGLSDQPSREQVQPLLGLTCLWWSFALLWVKGYPSSALLWRSLFMRSAMGILITSPAVTGLRPKSDL